MDNLSRATAAAAKAAPVGLRELARTAGVSHSLLAYIVSGQRRATPAVAGAVAGGLEALGERAVLAAKELRRALPQRGNR